jgi:hypothetical protein
MTNKSLTAAASLSKPLEWTMESATYRTSVGFDGTQYWLDRKASHGNQVYAVFTKLPTSVGSINDNDVSAGWHPNFESAMAAAQQDQDAKLATWLNPAREISLGIAIDLEHESYRSIMGEATKAKWHPPEYTANDVQADILQWLQDHYVPNGPGEAATSVVVTIEGGVVSSLIADGSLHATVIDYDDVTDLADLRDVPQADGRTCTAVVTERSVEVDPARVAELKGLIDAEPASGMRP